MRKMLLGAAAVALMAAPGVAHADGGYVDVFGGNDDIEITGLGSGNSNMWGIDGVVGFSNAQIGAHYTSFDELTDNVWSLDGHLFARNDAWQLGGGVGVTSIDDSNEWAVAGEGLLFYSRTTLGADVVYSNADDTDTTFWGIDGEARFFLTDNFRIGVNAGWGNFDSDTGGGDADMTTIGASAEWQFDNTPFSVFAGINHSDADGFNSDAWAVGARWNFGGQTLLERDRHGPNLRTLTGGFSRLFGF